MKKSYFNLAACLSQTVCFKCLLYIFLLFIASVNMVEAQRVRYVSATPKGKQDGTSWANASSDLHKMINQSASNDQVWVEGDFKKPTIYTKVVAKDKNSGVKGYIMKMCTYKDENPTSYIFMDPHRPVRIPRYSFQVMHSKSKVNPSLYLVLQIV
jgi:hypothetical protein